MLKLIIAGPLGADAEVRNIDGGRAAISFSVAHSEKWKDAQGQQKERTTWVRCTVWRKSDQTGVSEYLKKGTKVVVEGTPSARAWANANGEPQASLELNVSNLELMGGSQPRTQAAPEQNRPISNVEHWKQQEAAAKATPTPVFSGTIDDDDLPF